MKLGKLCIDYLNKNSSGCVLLIESDKCISMARLFIYFVQLICYRRLCDKKVQDICGNKYMQRVFSGHVTVNLKGKCIKYLR